MGIFERFWNKVDIRGDDECWPWLACRVGGYGHIFNDRPRIAHRVGWELVYGPIPDGLCVLHSCDNPPCCNPEHLFLGTQLDNMKDMTRKGRRLGIRTTYGSKHPCSKLSETDVLEICNLYVSGKYLQKELAHKFGVSRPHISLLVNKRGWRHILK